MGVDSVMTAAATPLRSAAVWALAAIAVNVVMLLVVFPVTGRLLHSYYNQNVYADGYDQLAANLAAGHGYRFYADTADTLMREPGYPVFLAGIFLAFGHSLVAVKLANMLLALLTAWLLFHLVGRLTPNPTVALITPLLFLFHPAILTAESRGGVEMLFVAALVLFLLTLYRALERGTYAAYALAGGVLGLTVLIRSTPILFPAFLLAYLVVFERQAGALIPASARIGGRVGVMVLAAAAVLSPWIARNYRLTGHVVPTASVLGVSAHAGQYICSHLSPDGVWSDLDRQAAQERMRIADALGYRYKDVQDGYYQIFYSSADEVAFSSHLLRNVARTYRESPFLFAQCAGANVFNLWFAGKTWTSTAANVVVQLPCLLVAAVGVGLAVRAGQLRRIAPILLFICCYVAVYVPILAQARYSVPLIPLLAVLAAPTVAWLYETQPRAAWPRRRGPTWPHRAITWEERKP